MAKVKILHDYVYEGWEHLGEAVVPGTVVEVTEFVADPWGEYRDDVAPLAAVYPHPVSGEPWISYHGAYEVVEA